MKRVPLKRSDNPDVIYGRDFEEEAMKIEELIGDMGEVTIRGKVLSVDTRDIKNEKTIIIFNMSDFTDTMTIKMFVRTEHDGNIDGGGGSFGTGSETKRLSMVSYKKDIGLSLLVENEEIFLQLITIQP